MVLVVDVSVISKLRLGVLCVAKISMSVCIHMLYMCVGGVLVRKCVCVWGVYLSLRVCVRVFWWYKSCSCL